MEVYLDNSATTRTFPEVAELMSKIMCEDYGNPSSMHNKGVQAERYVRYGRETLAKILKVNEKEIYFTSGGKLQSGKASDYHENRTSGHFTDDALFRGPGI